MHAAQRDAVPAQGFDRWTSQLGGLGWPLRRRTVSRRGATTSGQTTRSSGASRRARPRRHACNPTHTILPPITAGVDTGAMRLHAGRLTEPGVRASPDAEVPRHAHAGADGDGDGAGAPGRRLHPAHPRRAAVHGVPLLLPPEQPWHARCPDLTSIMRAERQACMHVMDPVVTVV